jgi:hypothetical protein
LTLVEALTVIAILVALAALLLPRLIAAHEASLENECLNNLGQISKAFEWYCSDYVGYLPCYAGWGFDPSLASTGATYSAPGGEKRYQCAMSGLIGGGAVRTDEPLNLPQFGGAPVGNGCGRAFPGVNFFRTCFFGSPLGAPEPPTAGNACFAGPVGLGNLLACGYVMDAKLLMCPSAGDMPWDAGARYAGHTVGDIATLKGMGSDDQFALCRGDYPALAAKMNGTGWQGVKNVYGFQSSYNYRGVPISAAGGGKPGLIRSADFSGTTTPGVIVNAGCPQFKTQKLLLGRAVACDTFSKWDDASVPAEKKAGYGAYAHRDSYNVLYGDWHAKVVGDPDRRILNWSQSARAGTPLDQAEISASIATIAYATSPDENPHSSYAVLPDKDITASEGFLIWHYFDTIEQIDLSPGR